MEEDKNQTEKKPKIAIDLDKYRKASVPQASEAQDGTPRAQHQEQKTTIQKGFRPPGANNDPQAEQQQRQISEEEIIRQKQHSQYVIYKQNSLQNQTFSYLDIFDRQTKFHQEAQDEFYQTQEKEDQDVESKKPAYFQKEQEFKHADGRPMTVKEEQAEAHYKLQNPLKMDFNPDNKTQEELREFFKISKDKNSIDHMNEQVFEYLYARMKERQIGFYAFLNKEFNIMNFKSARCSMHCFDSDDRSLKDVNECLSLCRQGISGCRDFAFNLQKTAEDEVEVCQEEAKNLKTLTDPIIHWISCYEKLILKFDSMENEITQEFGHFI